MGPFAAADVQVATRNNQSVPRPLYIQMDTHHAYLTRSGQAQVELELSDPPASLQLLHPYVEIEDRSGSEPDRVTRQFINAIFKLAEMHPARPSMLASAEAKNLGDPDPILLTPIRWLFLARAPVSATPPRCSNR